MADLSNSRMVTLGWAIVWHSALVLHISHIVAVIRRGVGPFVTRAAGSHGQHLFLRVDTERLISIKPGPDGDATESLCM